MDKYLQNRGINVVDVSKLFYFTTVLSDELIDELIIDTEKILQNKSSISYDSYLAGKIDDGKQILIDESWHQEKSIKQLIEIIGNISEAYMERFLSKIDRKKVSEESFDYSCNINDMWVVNQLAHDYNPPHNHQTNEEIGLSGVLYLEVPEQIGNYGDDGLFYFSFGPDVGFDIRRLTFTDRHKIIPKKGGFLLFPKNTCHQVFPFRGSGERRCIAFNVNIKLHSDKNN